MKTLNLVFVYLIISLVISGCNSFSNNEITVYEAWFSKNGDLFSLHKLKYKVSFDNQTVIYWWPESDNTPIKLVNCVVRDKTNWTGEFLDGSAKLSMVNGKITMNPPNDQFYLKQISFIHWLFLKSKLGGI